MQDNEGDIEEEHEEVGINLTWQESEGRSLFSVYSPVAGTTDRDLRCHRFKSFAESVFSSSPIPDFMSIASFTVLEFFFRQKFFTLCHINRF